MIHYNNPEYAKERQNVVPPNSDDLTIIISGISHCGVFSREGEKVIQALIWHYENLVHNNEVKVPELKRLLAEKRDLQKQMDEAMQESWGTNKEPNEYYAIAHRKNEITEQIEKLIEQL